MEFPGLGDHCQEVNCKVLDFLPFRCDSCKKIYCKDHIHYNKHPCNEDNLKSRDFQVPLCPLCNEPVPYKRTELPDAAMSSHIDRDCKSDPAEERRRKIYNNKCFVKGCKQKEIIPFSCQRCKQNYCLRHRLEEDHECTKLVPDVAQNNAKDLNNKRLLFFQQNQQTKKTPALSSSSSSAAATSTNRNEIQPRSMSEKEAMDYAIRLSLQEQKPNNSSRPNVAPVPAAQATAGPVSQETEDEILARVLAQSELEYRNSQRTTSSTTAGEKKESCSIN